MLRDENTGQLPAVSHDRISRLFRAAERIWKRRPDLQAAFPDVRVWDFWSWLVWHGPKEHPELGILLDQDPPLHLIHRVVGETTTPENFRLGGLSDWRRIRVCLEEGGFDFERGGRILDFGCGCGRILRYFARYVDTCEFSGVDVDEGAVEWCRRSIDFAGFERVGAEPPTSFSAGRFDAVYAFSVFSHLPETLHRRWLEELYRITRPGGVVVLTLHGRRVIERLIARASPEDIPSSAELQRDFPRILEDGFAFYPYRPDLGLRDEENRQHFAAWDMAQYGTTFISSRYVHERWSDLFHVVSWSLAPDDWQDYVVLRRLSGS